MFWKTREFKYIYTYVCACVCVCVCVCVEERESVRTNSNFESAHRYARVPNYIQKHELENAANKIKD